MSGAPPYSLRSPPPAQQSTYNSYSSSPPKGRPYYPNDDRYQQHPPETPQAYGSSYSRSPHFVHASSPLANTLPPLNGGPHSDTSPSYPGQHPASGPSGFSLPRIHTAHGMSDTRPSSYGQPGHSHPPSRLDSQLLSPKKDPDTSFMSARENGSSRYIAHSPKPTRTADPMSFASILSEPTEDTPPPRRASPPPPPPPSHPLILNKEPEPTPVLPLPRLEKKPSVEKRPLTFDREEKIPLPTRENGSKKQQEKPAPVVQARPMPGPRLTQKDLDAIERKMAEIDRAEKSDVEDDTGFEAEFKLYIAKSKKRAMEADNLESHKIKRRRNEFLMKLSANFASGAEAGAERFRRVNEREVISEVQRKEVQDEKERKKDMQRKRRRENTVRIETAKKLEAERRAKRTVDPIEKEKLLREAEKAQKKIKGVKRALERGNQPAEISEVTPLAPNMEGGTTSTFHIGKEKSPSAKKRPSRPTPSARPKKSKEKKQAEKDAAEMAYLAAERDELIAILPKDELRAATTKKDAKGARSEEATPTPATSFETKGYNQIYEQIWRDIARKDIPKVYRIKTMSLSTRQENLRKTAQLASKQSRKWQERTNKSTKDTQARAKRTMREMMSFWKRNEREERDLRRMAEKQELEMAKKAEADREANRQKRKLNFLISQTELYSHFIGRKIKTDEAEATSDPSVQATGETVQPGKPNVHTINLPDSVADTKTKVTAFEDLDFDAEDETELRRAAMANAQNAVEEAQARARAFNNEENPMAALDEGEMNFQNPTSLGDIQISQPKMLTAQLKEYQLKGLNWLVNLYEQGINGILADEMGLGKTVQSISVMAYLAEVHNIWGPFLVIAPASTLHNWQQEITKFVPDIKVLPYWGSAKDRKILRKFWDRKHLTYTRESEFHVLVTSYQLVVLDAQYFQKVKWQYMILDEAQAIKSSQSSRWKNLLGFSCRNRLLLTGTPIQNNMQELWALLHFIMPTLFDSHDEFSEWFSKDIESHAQSNTKLNEDQLRRLHMILKPFMLRRVKKHVQQELGDKVEKDVFCDLTYRQRAYYSNLRNRVSIMDLIEKAAVGDETDSTTLMNLVMQFRKVCNHPDLFERADTHSPFSMAHFAETGSFLREGHFVDVRYSTRNFIKYDLPRLLFSDDGRLDIPGSNNPKAGFRNKYLSHLMNIWSPENIKKSITDDQAFSFLRFVDVSPQEAYETSRVGLFERAVRRRGVPNRFSRFNVAYDKSDGDNINSILTHSLFNVVERNDSTALYDSSTEGYMRELLTVSQRTFEKEGLAVIEPAARPAAAAPPITISCSGQAAAKETNDVLFNVPARQALFATYSRQLDEQIVEKGLDPAPYSHAPMLPEPISYKARYTKIEIPSMRRFVTDSGKLAKLDELLRELKNGGHRVLLYFQMTRMIDLMEEYLTYRNYKYCRLDGSTKLEDRRDTVADFQHRPEIFVFLLSTRAGGLGINLTAADTVIFYDSDWNPTIDSQAMDRAHRLGQTRQVTVYRLITRGTIEERIRKRALQKEEVQRVVISGGAAGGVDFNTRHRENRTKDIAMWLADDEQAELIEQKEREAIERGEDPAAKKGKKAQYKKKKDLTLDDMYHEGEGHFDDVSAKPSGAATPVSGEIAATSSSLGKKRSKTAKGPSKRAKTTKERLRLIDGDNDPIDE
ncbi:SNF2 family helicase/ATPase (Ino80), putative [Talaromyces stipitatus ATCC 10500]|uniref:Chromatin-remodeling ATPase INO80 n=1 Tax=Talaromyces stipitatus (strain ATCC 10500 / CBS 375.48 / QM 6759 / NRRL 1006) TaxID=441959 RepID=B8MBV0_TALSN|nr:SNF2 family helicase/ATPase (Ino80), putative [Talaromyces stipitatus ATCC 10500]EED18233.1 SNF2 family helicase/ATPase (Ino80), putative [Talaromyces stipitatus ATCC 10500]